MSKKRKMPSPKANKRVQRQTGKRRPSAPSTQPSPVNGSSDLSDLPANQSAKLLRQTAVIELQQRVGNRAVQQNFRQGQESVPVQRFFGLDSITDTVSKGIEIVADFMTSASAINISQSVGRGGANERNDVITIQNRLRALGFLTQTEKPDKGDEAKGAVPDGALSATIAAIERYQSEVLGFRRPDGRVDPGGKTNRALNAWKKEAGTAGVAAATPGRSESSTAPGRPGSSTAPAAPSAVVVGQPSPPAAGRTELQDKELAAFVAALNNAAATSALNDLADLQKKFDELKRDRNEGVGRARDELVADIARLRQNIAGLDSAGLDPAALAKLKRNLYRAVNDVAPYYSQGRNINLLEGREQAKELGTKTSVGTRTCNITSLSMALESLGKSAGDYDGSKRDAIAAAAKVFRSEVGEAELTVAGENDAWSKVAGLRLPDFMQLAAIAEVLSSGKASNAAVTAAAVKAWDKILSIYFLKTLAGRFGASAEVKLFTLDPSKSTKEQKKDTDVLAGWGSSKSWGKKGTKRRSAVEKIVDARNQMEAATGKTREAKQKEYERLMKRYGSALSGAGIEERLPLESYKNAVVTQIGAEFEAGAAVVVSLSGHYVRLQAIHEDHVVVDDPGQAGRANRNVTWAEARAMGYFLRRLVIQ
jgi:hypothetical protein